MSPLPVRENDEYIMHVGKLGMKWGKRTASAGTAVKDFVHPAPVPSRFKSVPSKLTDAELKKRVNRMQMEKQYSSLNVETSTHQVSAGRAFAQKLLTDVGKNSTTAIATATVTAVGMFAVKQVIKSKFGEETMKTIFPKKK